MAFTLSSARKVARAPTCHWGQRSRTIEEEHIMSKSKDRGGEKKKKKLPKEKTKLPTV